MHSEDILLHILADEHIRSVYQPIVSLRDGTIHGYEALSRISYPDCQLNIEQLFELASKTQTLWELEKLCRTKALNGARKKPSGSRIFLNVDPNILHSAGFIAGFTRDKLAKLQLNPDDIIFEITEKNAISLLPVFTEAITHYQQQGFQIAIDDFGSGYSGLIRACTIATNYIKIDMSIVRGIDHDFRKRSVALGVMKFCREAGIQVIAEGIETKEELLALLDLGVAFGQGYFLGHPQEEFQLLKEDIVLLLQQLQKDRYLSRSNTSDDTVGMICQQIEPILPTETALSIYERMKADPALTELCIADHDGRVRGLLTRNYLLWQFSGQFGYNLHFHRAVDKLLGQYYLAVDFETTLDEAAAIAMQREPATVYDAIVVTKQDRYYGLVTVRDLLIATIRIREKKAADANPLTGFPGNKVITQKLGQLLHEPHPYGILYLDLDNFKAYNDAYGFAQGDCMLKALAQAMLHCCTDEDFLGHVGGDDFVIITHDLESIHSLCDDIIQAFTALSEPLYSLADWNKGYIISRNRKGKLEAFPNVTLSIAAITNRNISHTETETLSKLIAATKLRCKQIKGNAVIII